MFTFIAIVGYLLLVGFFASKMKDNENSALLVTFAFIIGVIMIACSRPSMRCDENGTCLDRTDIYQEF